MGKPSVDEPTAVEMSYLLDLSPTTYKRFTCVLFSCTVVKWEYCILPVSDTTIGYVLLYVPQQRFQYPVRYVFANTAGRYRDEKPRHGE